MARRAALYLSGVITAAVLFTGCAQSAQVGGVAGAPMPAQPQSLADVKANLKKDVVIDLAAADALAVAGLDGSGTAAAPADPISHACFPVLSRYLGTSTPTVGQIQGVFSAYEKARLLRLKAGIGTGGPAIPTELRMGCAPLLIDEQTFFARLNLLIGAGVASGGIVP